MRAQRARRFFTRRRVIVAVVVVAAAGAGGGAWAASGSDDPAGATYRSVAVTSGTFKQTVSTSGTLEPAQRADLDFGVSGRVTAVNVAVGQTVTAGQGLATVDSASLQASVAQAQASLSGDQSKLSSDESSGASSAQVAADQAAVTAAQNQLTDAQQSLADATLSSPIAGTVAAVNLTVGQQVSGSGSTGSSGTGGTGTGGTGSGGTGNGTGTGGGSQTGGSSGTGSGSSSGTGSSSSAQVTVISTTSFVVNASVDATEVGQVKQGDQAEITADGATGTLYGTVSTVGLLPSTSSGVADYPVTIAVTGSQTGLYAGTSATVAIIVKQESDILQVPTTAIHYNGSQAEVSQMVNGKVTDHAVSVGSASGGYTQITSGLSEGDQVLVPVTTNRGGGQSGSDRTGGRTGTFGGGGGFGGGGLGGGGFSGSGFSGSGLVRGG